MATTFLASCFLFTVAASIWWPSAQCAVLSAVRKSQEDHLQESENVLDLVELVNGHHPDAIAYAIFNNTINETGWSFLDIRDMRHNSGNNVYKDIQMAEIAGFLEGNMTASLIDMYWHNTFTGYCDDKEEHYCDRLHQFINNNLGYCEKLFPDSYIPEYYQASLWFAQLQGMIKGYNYAGYQTLEYMDFLMLQLFGDLDALESTLSATDIASPHPVGSGSCSALVKLLPQNKELYVAHDTWREFNSMLRVFKRYELNYAYSSTLQDHIIPGNVQVFSSYPGLLHSGDDYYLLSSGMVAMETTIGNTNSDLWQYVTPENFFEPVRVVVANRLARTGQQWAAHFSQYNMGTYNNEWMVVDYKLFVPGDSQLKDGLLWVIEQIPGIVKSSDQTDMLRKTSYWPSYNIAYYPEIFNLSGMPAMVDKYGDWFTWSGAPRAKIFARNISHVTDLQSMIALMRYNNFKSDELSQCACSPPYSAENAISARSDLNPSSGTYPFSALGHRSHGGTDMKVTSFNMFGGLSCVAVSGPTHDQQPIFQWSSSGFTDSHLGHPDKWDFDPITITWTT